MPAKALGVSGVLFEDRRKFDLDNADIAMLYPELNPFLAWLSDVSERPVTDPDFKMFQDTGAWRNQSFLANGTTSATNAGSTFTVAVDTPVNCAVDSSLIGLELEVWDTTQTTYKGVALVTAVSGANVTAVVVGKADASNQQMPAIADNDVFRVFSHGAGEGTTSPEAYTDELTVAWNSTQITRVPVEITRTLRDTALRAGGSGVAELARLREVAMKKFKLYKEQKILMGYRRGGIAIGASGTAGSGDTWANAVAHVNDANGNRVRTTAGFLSIMRRYGRTSGASQNWFNFAKGTLTYTQLIEAMEKVAQYGGSIEREAFCGPQAMSYWTSLANAQNSGFDINVSEMKTDETYGFKYKYLETGHLVIKLIPMPLFYNTPYAGYMLMPRKDTVERAVFHKDSYFTDIKKDNNYDGQKDEYFSDDGLSLTQTDANAVIVLS